MSDNWVKLVPRKEVYIPSTASQETAADHFWDVISDCEDVESMVFNTLQFFDAGINGCANCPNCGEIVEGEFWEEWLAEDEDVDQGFKFQPRTLPCCGKSYTLRDLDYDYDQGFGQFCLEALIMDPLTTNQVKEFEQILGCSLRVIYAHL